MSRFTFLVIVVLFTLTGVTLASVVKSQNLREIHLSLQLKDAKLKEALTEISKKTGLTFVYTEALGNQVNGINLVKNTSSLYKLLKELASKNQLRFEQSNYLIAVTKAPKPPKPGKISGKIIDNKGEALPGAGIKIMETGQSLQASVDGTYNISLPPGNYTMEISYISFQTKRISEVLVKEDQLIRLDVVLNPSTNALDEVVISSSYKKESIAGLYAQQKNAASMTDGISAEQIARNPDNNVGAVLKRISGITTIDNKYVVVRGMAERYNQAMVDGISVPSTDLNRRNFSFDVVPAELVSSVVVNKTATPDVSAQFSGGQVIVNTLAIPASNFMSITAGTGANSRTTGKDFLQVGGRGKNDYFAFDDGNRKQPGDIKYWVFPVKGIGKDNPTDYLPSALEQSKRFNPNGFKLYTHSAAPNQNYRLAIGQLYDLNKQTKLGFLAALTYRNTQELNDYTTTRGYGHVDVIDTDTAGKGKVSKFSTSLGGTLNAGIQGEKYKISLRNLYTRMLNDDAYEVYKRQDDDLGRKQRSIIVDPVFTNILQNKLDGEHKLTANGLLLDWNAARTSVGQDHKDLRRFTYGLTADVDGQEIYQAPVLATTNNLGTGFDYDYRVWTQVKQTDYNWGLNLSQPFSFLKDKSLVKLGYSGSHKARNQNTLLVNLYSAYTGQEFDLNSPYDIILTPENQGWGQNKGYYFANAENSGDQYEGSSKYHAAYLMLDQRFFQKLRLVYGIRAEHFDSRNAQLSEMEKRRRFEAQFPGQPYTGTGLTETSERNWKYLPSANLTYSLNAQMNIRAAYSKTMIRPDLRETATMAFVDPLLRGEISGGNLLSTAIKNYDLRYEWYPKAGEIISISGFYKDFENPVELMKSNQLNKYYYTNQKSAYNLGIEMEVRKSLDFLGDQQWLSNLSLFGNATMMKSKVNVVADKITPGEVGSEPTIEEFELEVKRPLFGQSPYILNAGISYNSRHFGLNAVFNRSGHRTYSVEFDPNNIEYENGRNLLDLQLSTKLLKQKAELRLNISNLLDAAATFYINADGYDVTEDQQQYFAKPGKKDNYKKREGDILTHRMKYGRTASLSFTYNF